MKVFIVKNKIGTDPDKAPIIADIIDGYDVTWHYYPDKYIGEVPDEQFVKLQHAFEETGFYVMFEDCKVHTH